MTSRRHKFQVFGVVTLVWSLLGMPVSAYADGQVDPVVQVSAVTAGSTAVRAIAVAGQEVFFALGLEDFGSPLEPSLSVEIGSVAFDAGTGSLDGNSRWSRTFSDQVQADIDLLQGGVAGISHAQVSPDGAYVYFLMNRLFQVPPRLIRVDTATKDVAVLSLTSLLEADNVRSLFLSPNGEVAYVRSQDGLVRVQLFGQSCPDVTSTTCGGMGEEADMVLDISTFVSAARFAAGMSRMWLSDDDMRLVEFDLEQMRRTGRELNLTHPEYQQDDSWIGWVFTHGDDLYATVIDGRTVEGVWEERGRLVKIDPVSFTVVDNLLLGTPVVESYLAVSDPSGTYAYLVEGDEETQVMRVDLSKFVVVDVFAPQLDTGQRLWNVSTVGRYVVLGTSAPTQGVSQLITVKGAEVVPVPQTPSDTQNLPSGTGGVSPGTPAAANLARMVACDGSRPARFVDVPVSSTHASAIGCLFAGEIVAGFGEDMFRPHAAMTRGQVASMLFRVLVNAGWEPVVGDASFVDVAGVHQEAIVGLANAGIVSGFGEGRFAPDAAVTRGQLATMLVRASETAGRPLATATPSFVDVRDDSPHAAAVGALQQAGMVAGYADGTFRAANTVTRGQVASMLVRWLDPSRTTAAALGSSN